MARCLAVGRPWADIPVSCKKEVNKLEQSCVPLGPDDLGQGFATFSNSEGRFPTPLGLLLAEKELGDVKAKLHIHKCCFYPGKERPTPDALCIKKKKKIISDVQLKLHRWLFFI